MQRLSDGEMMVNDEINGFKMDAIKNVFLNPTLMKG